MCVTVQRHRCLSVPVPISNGLHVHSGCNQSGDAEMSQVMKTALHIKTASQSAEPVRNDVRIRRLASVVHLVMCEHVGITYQRHSTCCSCFLLMLPTVREH